MQTILIILSHARFHIAVDCIESNKIMQAQFAYHEANIIMCLI